MTVARKLPPQSLGLTIRETTREKTPAWSVMEGDGSYGSHFSAHFPSTLSKSTLPL